VAGFLLSIPSVRGQIADRGHVLLDRRRRGLALKHLDVSRDRNGLNIFEMLTDSLQAGHELLDRAVVSQAGVLVPDRNR